jgi:hypothetical protein
MNTLKENWNLDPASVADLGCKYQIVGTRIMSFANFQPYFYTKKSGSAIPIGSSNNKIAGAYLLDSYPLRIEGPKAN